MKDSAIEQPALAQPSGAEQFAASQAVRFDRDIRPILSDKCFFCHGPDREHRESDLRLDLEAAAMESAIVPGDVESSELILRIRSADPDEIMPPPDAHKTLSAEEVDLITRWIAGGATWTQHWSFTAPTSADLPGPKPAGLAREAIDAFVRRRLQKEGLTMAKPAEREKLIRRVSFDLTGLPPTLEQIDAFLADSSADAYEKVVDRLLRSHHYGERMALMWMDAARYGDTSVYHADGPREMWAWRDAVVDAYNQNMAFDEFSISQIAGDLLPEPTMQQRILAGFNRNNGTTDEGGAIAEEYRVEYAVDRVKTTSTVWLGLTMECAQCHDHKYDPITQEEYYRFYAFFNASRDGGMQTRKGNAEPKLDIPDPEKQRLLPEVQQQLVSTNKQMQSRAAACEGEFSRWVKDQEAKLSDPVLPSALASFSLIAGQGDSVADSVHSDRVGKIIGKAKWVQSRHDWALEFNGDNYVDLGDIANFERSDSFSYGGWVKPNKGQTGALLARMDDGDRHRGYDLLVGDGPISVHLIHAWPANAIKVVTKKRLAVDRWQHVLVTYDGSSKASGISIYVGGEKWDWKIEQDGLTGSIKTDKSLLIGSRHPGSRLKGSVDETHLFSSRLDESAVQSLANALAVRSLLAMDSADRSEAQVKSLRDYFLVTEDDRYQEIKKQFDSLSNREAELKKPMTSVMVMGDMDSPRDTFILNRGAYDAPTDHQVQPGTLSALPPMENDAPRNRLGLARWLFRPDHPLTARVAVNRYWQMLFGVGLVASPEDFGAQGQYPTHPELLDWLAVDFRTHRWNVKRLIKEVVMSSTYRQSSSAQTKLYRQDPENRLIARGPRFRLQGELIRDNALAISGLLVNKMGGPGVKPYQPPGLWAEVGLGGNPKFSQDHGESLYRRSLYTYWKRSAPPPAMLIFDAPTREKCAIRRARTNTPLQALATLNDVQFVEASRHFAERFIHEGGRSVDDRIVHAFRLATARAPSDSERSLLNDIFTDALNHYSKDVEAAKSLVSAGEAKRDEALDVAHHAAWTIVASTLLNLDETLTRE